MKRLLLITVLLAVAAIDLRAGGAGVVQSEYVEGRPLPAIRFVDDSGRWRSTDEWKGVPTILAPIYTRCPIACPMITAGLKRGAAESKSRPDSYRVVLFSFDPRDTPASLRAFRERRGVPLAWTVATAKPEDVRLMLDGIGYRVSESNGQFTHPNAAIAFTPDLRTAKYLRGTSFSGSDIDEALEIARGDGDWIGRFGPWMLAILLLVCLLSLVYLLVQIGTLRERRDVVREVL